MYFLRTVQWKGRSSGIFDKPVVFVGVQESYWPWCSAYHHQKNTACPGKKGKEKNSQTAKVKTSVLMYVIYPKYSLECENCEKTGLSVRFFLHSTLYWILNWQLTELAKPWRENIEFSQLLFLLILYILHVVLQNLMPCDMETVLYLDGVILPTASSVRLKNVSNHSLFLNLPWITSLWVFQATLLAFGSWKRKTSNTLNRWTKLYRCFSWPHKFTRSD